MNTRFDTPSRCSATGVTTVSILVVMLAMAVSTLFPADVQAPSATAAAGHIHVTKSHHADQLRDS